MHGLYDGMIQRLGKVHLITHMGPNIGEHWGPLRGLRGLFEMLIGSVGADVAHPCWLRYAVKVSPPTFEAPKLVCVP